MKRINTDLKHDDEMEKIPLSKRLIILLFYYIRLGLHDLEHALTHITDKKKRVILWQNICNFVCLFYKKAAQETILKESAALTFITLLGFVPFMFLIVFFIPKIPFLSSTSKLQAQLYQNFMPMSTGDIGAFITKIISQEITFNIVSFIMVIITSYSLFRVIRDTFDRILVLEYKPPKDLVSQLAKFFGTIIIGFIIILLLFSSSSLPIISSLLNIPLFRKQLIFLLPFILQFVGLVLLYMILPSIKISRKSLFRAAFWTTLVWVIMKGMFDYYVYNLTNIEAVYGVLRSLPAFLFWVYVNWIIVLGGIILVSILEHKEMAIRSEKNKHFVRLTLEMYTNKKLDKDIDAIISKDSLPEIVEKLMEEVEE